MIDSDISNACPSTIPIVNATHPPDHRTDWHECSAHELVFAPPPRFGAPARELKATPCSARARSFACRVARSWIPHPRFSPTGVVLVGTQGDPKRLLSSRTAVVANKPTGHHVRWTTLK